MIPQLSIGYVRVSSVEQERGFGPEVQAAAITKYCTEQGLPAPEIHHESKSGESLIKRSEIHLVLARAEAATEEGITVNVIFYSLDRLARDLIDQESVVMRCFRTGVRLHSTDPSEHDTLDPAYADDPMRTAIRQFFGIIHQLDRAIIQRRLDSGLARKAAQGGFTGGRPPFGYASINQDLTPDPQASAAVVHTFQLKAAGMNLEAIAAIVARAHPGICGHWRKQQVSRVLKSRDLYTKGIYSPRGTDIRFHRPELIIVSREAERADGPSGLMDIKVDDLPDPIRLNGLAYILGSTEDTLRKLISQHGILVRWRGSSPLVPRESARKLAVLISQK